MSATFATGYDFVGKKITMTQIGVTRHAALLDNESELGAEWHNAELELSLSG